MKLRTLFLALLVMFAGVATAQVESGKVYRIVSGKYKTVVTANPVSHKLSCVTAGGDEDYQQMWKFTLEEDGKYSIMNVFSQRYLQNEKTTNVQFKTGTAKVTFAVTENESFKGYYNIDENVGGNWGLHCASGGAVVPWSYGPDKEGLSGSEWYFSEVSITEAQMEAAAAEYQNYNAVIANKDEIIAAVETLFADKTGTELKPEYAAMADEDLRAVMEEPSIPAELQEIVLKVKNDSWATEARENLSEKNFRVYEYYPYSNPEKWAEILYTRPFNRINNPTGISTLSDKGFIYVFVDEIPEGTEVYLAEMLGTAFWGTDTQLNEGLNIVPAANKDGVLYIRYVCDTHTGKLLAGGKGVDLTKGKKLADYPRLKIHIEGGYVNGFWSKERGHTNEDWVYMRDNMFKNPTAVQAAGDHSVLNFRTKEFLMKQNGYWDGYKEQGCPEEIEEVMAMWDFWNMRQKHYMNLDKYAEYHNNKQLAMSDDNGFMDASSYRTHYNNNTLTTIVNIDRITRDAGSAWGPNHEIGHTNQYAFQIVGTSEVSNNALTNFVIFDQGTHVSRGNNMDNQILDFENKIPYVERGEGYRGSKLFSMTRMYFQLFLYFHAIGHDKEFYPKLFERLRFDRLVGWTTSARDEIDPSTGYYYGSMDAANDQLKFAEICCEIGNIDLTEFFEAWGFFIPMKNSLVGDYGHHYVYLTQEAIDACKARIKAKNYPKKGGHLIFLEDRIKPSPLMMSDELNAKVGLYDRIKGDYYIAQGYRGNYAEWQGERIGEVGDFGQWNDYIDESVKAQGYYYAVSNGVLTIMEAENASGALGFKMYDAETGELLTYTNRKSMKVPVSAAGKALRVVAAQADGTDFEVLPASQGPEEMQRDALSAALETAKWYTFREAFDLTMIGRFYPDSIKYLKDIYNKANAAYKNNDTSERSFAEWSVMLANECSRLALNEDARIRFDEGMTVNMLSIHGREALKSSTQGLVADADVDFAKEAACEFSIEYAGTPDTYYIKCGNGYYISSVEEGVEVYADAASTAAAAKFRIEYAENGNIYFSTVGSTPLSFGYTSDKVTIDGKEYPRVKGLKLTDSNIFWIAYIKNDNSAASYKAALDEALVEANCMITEIINVDSLNTMNIFNDNILVLDRNLETFAMDLYNLYANAVEDIDNAKMHRTYLNSFRDLFDMIDGTYVTMYPVPTKDNKVVLYRMRNIATDLYLSIYRKDSRLSTVKAFSVDDDALWCFASTGSGDYKMYNYGCEGFVAPKSKTSKNLVVGEDAVPVAVAYDREQAAALVTMNDLAFDELSTGYVNLKDPKRSTSYWTFEIAGIEEDENLAGIVTAIESILPEGNYNDDIYDLHGRKVTEPAKGIYIQNGRKVYFK